jgi:hypothetical protein
MKTVDREKAAYGYSERPPVAKALRASGGRLVAALTVSSVLAIVSYLIFDFDLIAVVAVPIVLGGIALALAVLWSGGRGVA